MSEPREIHLGCGSIVFLALIVTALWTIGGALKRIAYQMTLANCWTMAADGVECSALRASDTRRMAETVKQGSVRSTGSAVPEGEAPQ